MKRKKKNTYGKESLKAFIIAFHHAQGRVPSRQDLNESPSMPSYSTYKKFFGTYSNAVRYAGFEPNKRILTPKEVKRMNKLGRKVLRKQKIESRRYNEDGFILIYRPRHSNSDSNGYILEHRYLMSKQLRRPLGKNEQVYHKNRKRDDNRINNLTLNREDMRAKKEVVETKNIYRVPVSLMYSGYVIVEATSIKESVKEAYKKGTLDVLDKEYLDDSFQVFEDEIELDSEV